MATYFILANWTDEGLTTIRDSPLRLDKAKEIAASLGIELQDFYMTIGSYDFVVRLDAPNGESVARFSMAVQAGGAVRTVSLRAFTEQEYRAMIEAMP